MTTLGIIGGIAPGSTIDYYRLLIDRYRELRPDAGYPSIIINSIDLKRFLTLVVANDKRPVIAMLLHELGKLARAGADVALLASNTPHLVFDELATDSPVPLISIVEATGAAAKAQGYRKLGLLGTRTTMEGGFYPKVLSRYGVDVVVPNAADRDEVHTRYYNELIAGIFRDETRYAMTAVIDRMKATDNIDGVILGGTELPLLFRDTSPLIPQLDTTRIHVEAALQVTLQT